MAELGRPQRSAQVATEVDILTTEVDILTTEVDILTTEVDTLAIEVDILATEVDILAMVTAANFVDRSTRPSIPVAVVLPPVCPSPDFDSDSYAGYDGRRDIDCVCRTDDDLFGLDCVFGHYDAALCLNLDLDHYNPSTNSDHVPCYRYVDLIPCFAVDVELLRLYDKQEYWTNVLRHIPFFTSVSVLCNAAEMDAAAAAATAIAADPVRSTMEFGPCSKSRSASPYSPPGLR
ncbi:hypothetical protein BC936DRAFT_149705 [Jimgerdemannia flammicorona]|uniref:Uncharacterized protein n=1 Tax=Jimgerdemannia flammicorona TaxID=994334 RepID=A0A433D097_9FUNG|nr:hypothetical protein BC936DRAFT_149705 [Jimgerdemannia flammicorona]